LHLGYSVENHEQWKNEFDLNTNNKSNNLIFVPISTGKKTLGKKDKTKHTASCIPSHFFRMSFSAVNATDKTFKQKDKLEKKERKRVIQWYWRPRHLSDVSKIEGTSICRAGVDFFFLRSLL